MSGRRPPFLPPGVGTRRSAFRPPPASIVFPAASSLSASDRIVALCGAFGSVLGPRFAPFEVVAAESAVLDALPTDGDPLPPLGRLPAAAAAPSALVAALRASLALSRLLAASITSSACLAVRRAILLAPAGTY